MNNSQRRIGVLLPPGNVSVERELARFAPETVAINYNRLSRPVSKSTKSSLLSMAPSLERAATDLAHVHPEVILFACTSGSFLEGRGKEDEIARRISAYTGIAAITTSVAVTHAFDALAMTRVFMITPYPDDINDEEVAFLEHYGVEVAAYDSFRCETTELTAAIASQDVTAMALRHREAIEQCDGLFVSCTQLLTMDQIEQLEHALDVPVVTSNQATLWAGLRFLQVSTEGLCAGRLFETARVASV
ncbi:MAG: aspartate/glutamate racemase family protein [Burkholderiales bacterium]|nr:aspartate/glutamate racemase family protein [Burkholderiales bacterium]